MALRWQRPSLDTHFHIDMAWWEEQERDIRIYLQDRLCEECRTKLEGLQTDQIIDWIDEETGQVSRVDALWHCLRTCCSQQPDFIDENTPIVEAVFRTFLANGNNPLSITELHKHINRRPPQTLLRMLTAGDVYLGIRPIRE